MGYIVIFGSTGFLGMHIIFNLLQVRSEYKICCIVRESEISCANKKFMQIFHYYFGDEYEEIGSETSRVIHCGAIVKHFGKKEDFNDVNVLGTRRVIEFCMKYDAYMIFSSSIAVVEKMTLDGKCILREKNMSDEYVKSKIMAEKYIIEYKKKGLKCSIIRVGTLTGRYSDGAFQRNIEDNALYARMKTVVMSKCLPAFMLNEKMDFLPVDECAKAFCHVLEEEKEGIYLFYNKNTITYQEWITYLRDEGIFIKVKEYKGFLEYLKEVSKLGLKKEALVGFYLSSKRKHDRNLNGENMINFFEKNLFNWPMINKEYIKKILEYMKKVKYIEINMKNYVTCNPCKMYFGENVVFNLSDEIVKTGNRVLFVYGEKSIRQNGIYKQIKEQLAEKNILHKEYNGVMSNPTVEFVERGIQVCRQFRANIILAVGGGSVIDCSKAIAAGVYSSKTVWELVEDNSLVDKTIPIISVLTVSGAGSEMDGICSLSNKDIPNKRGITNEKLIPKVSFLDPSYTKSVPRFLSLVGVVDTMAHLLEQYLQNTVHVETQNAILECMLKKCFFYGKMLNREMQNDEARTNLMYISTYAMNGFLLKNGEEDWSLHPIEHQISAFYNITHGVGIAILLPEWLNAIFKPEAYDKFYEYGINVWNIDPNIDKISVGKLSIKKTVEFLRELKMPKSLRSVGIKDNAYFDIMSKRAYRTHISTKYLSLTKEEICDIYTKVLY